MNNPSYNLDVKGIGRIQGSSWGTTGDTTIIFLGDQNHKIEAEYNGVFKIRSLDPISLGTPTTEYFRILSTNGNVGIGATAPSTKLHIAGGDLTIGNNDARSLIFDDISTAKWKLNPTGYKLSFSNDSGGWGERVVFTNTGNVGIGTISPQENLDIVTSANGAGIKIGKANIAGYSALRLIGADDSSKYAYIQAGSSNLDDTAKLRVSRYGSATDTLALFEIYSSTAYFSGNVGIDTIQPTHKLSVNGDINITGTYRVNGTPLSSGIGGGGTANYLSKFTAGSTLSNSVIYENTNNIGIGITTPLSLLHLYSNFPSIIVQEANVNETSALIFKASTGATVGGIISNAATGEIRIGAINTAGAYFPTFYSNNSEIMRISTTGNVGIGTTTPMDKLHINDSSAINGWRARAVFSGLNKSAVIGVYNDSVIVGAHSANLGSWENIFINTGGDFTPTGNVYLPAAVGIATQSVPYALNFGTNKGILLNALTYGFAVEAITADTDYLKIKSVNAGTNTTYFDNILSLTRDGKIGVGTNSPNQKLHIYSHNAASNGGILLANSSANDATRAVVSAIQSNEIRGLSDVDLDAGQLRLSAGGGTNSNNISYIDLYGFSTRDMRFGTAGTEKMRILENGNIGIGTTSPADKLHINGGLIVGNTANTNAGTIRWTGANFEGYTGVQWKALDAEPTGSAGGWTDDGSVVRLTTSSDYVGIGAASPLSKLTIGGSALSDTKAAFKIEESFSDGVYIDFGAIRKIGVKSGGNFFMGFNFNYDAGTTNYLYETNLPASGVEYTTDGDINFLTASTGIAGNSFTPNNRMTIKNNGNVGIGTASPSQKLSIENAGAGMMRLNNSTLTGAGSVWDLNIGNTNSLELGRSGINNDLVIDSGGGIALAAGSFPANGAKLLVGNNYLTVGSTGFIGIGNAAPTHKLEVHGTQLIKPDALWSGGDSATLFLGDNNSYISNENGSSLNIGAFHGITINASTSNGSTDAHIFKVLKYGVEKFRIDNNGNVGIGNATPAYKLDVAGDINITGDFRVNGTTLAAGIGGSGTTNYIPKFSSGTTLTNSVLNESAGNIGIGLTPQYGKLEISAAAAAADIAGLYLRNGAADQSGNAISLTFATCLASSIGQAKISAIRAGVTGEGDLGFYTYNGAMNERLRITNTGNIGIGTANPAGTLDVRAANPEISINRSAATGYNHLKWGTAGTAFWSLQTQANQNDLQLYNYGTSSFILTMLASNGNVGVGTTNPASKLDVQGDIYASADNSVITALGDNMGIVKKAGTGPVIAAGSGDPLRLGHWNTATLRGNIASGSFTERMTIATNGNVGIGTASPAYQLEVKSSSPYISATATDGNGNAIIYADKGATGWGGYEMKVGGVEKFVMGIQPSATTLDWWVPAGATLMSLTPSGYLGIGATTPLAKLHLFGGDILIDRGTTTSNLARNLTIGGAQDSSGSDIAAINFQNYDNNSGAADYTAAKISSQNDDGAGKGDLRFSTYNGTALTTRMIISNSGNVGIGSANPNMILDIADTSSAGGIRITTHNSSTVNAPINIDNFCNSAAYGAALQIRRGRGTSDVPSAILTNDVIGGIYAKGHIGTGWGTSNVAAIRMLAAEDFSATNQGTKIDFATTDTGATTRSVKMTIASNGNVGIGKTNPSRILDIEDISTIEGGATISTQNSSVTNGLLNLDNYTNSVGSGASINVSRARGTKSVPAAILSGDVIGGLWAKGHTGTGWTSGNIASIRILADEDFSATNQGSSIDFSTTNLGTTSKTVKMTINANGKVGIGTATPGYLLTVNGEPAANGYTAFTNYSDRRLKTNIKPITNVLDKIVRLNPVSFNYNEKTGYNSEHLKKKFFGFIAQELQQIFPEMVGEIELNNEKYLDSNLSSLPVYLLQAIKEQGEIIEKSKIKMEELENIVNQLKIEIEMLKKNRK